MGVKVIPLDEAMLMTGFGKYNVGIYFLCATILIGMIFETLGLSYIIPAAQCDLQLTLTQKGWLGAIPFIGVIVSSHFWGWLADTRGRKPVIICSMALGSFFSIVSSICPNLLSFAILRMIAAFFIAGPTATTYAYLGEFNNPKYRDRMVTLGSAAVSIGTLIFPALAWLILPYEFRIPVETLGIEYRSWRLLILVLALPYVVCTLIMFKAPESPKFLASRGKTKEALEVIRKIHSSNNGKLEDPFVNIELESMEKPIEVSVLRSMWEQTVPLFKKPLLFYTCIACFVQMGVFASANGFILWMPEILNRMMNQLQVNDIEGTVCEILAPKLKKAVVMTSNSTIPIIIECSDKVLTGTFARSLILAGIYCPFMVIAAFSVHIIGKRNILIFMPLISGLAGYAIHWAKNQILTLILLAMIQAVGVCIGMMNAVVVEIFPTHLRAMAVSLSMMTGRVGSIIGSNLIGFLIELYCPSSFFLFASILILCSGINLLIPKPGLKPTEEQ